MNNVRDDVFDKMSQSPTIQKNLSDLRIKVADDLRYEIYEHMLISTIPSVDYRDIKRLLKDYN